MTTQSNRPTNFSEACTFMLTSRLHYQAWEQYTDMVDGRKMTICKVSEGPDLDEKPLLVWRAPHNDKKECQKLFLEAMQNLFDEINSRG